jgi:hypothetical protein
MLCVARIYKIVLRSISADYWVIRGGMNEKMITPVMKLAEAEVFPSAGCVGSMQWGIDTERAFDIKGLWQYGRTVTNADSHAHALELVLSYDCLWDDEAFTYVAPLMLEVWRVGPRWDYMRSEQEVFVIRQGKPMLASV